MARRRIERPPPILSRWRGVATLRKQTGEVDRRVFYAEALSEQKVRKLARHLYPKYNLRISSYESTASGFQA